MSDERYTFEATRTRLDEILVQVRKKDTSLEQSLELLEEGVRLANLCNELIDQTSWRPTDVAAGSDDVDDVGLTIDPEVPVSAAVEPPEDAPITAPIEDDARD
ncbi:MAG: exodeoxyribonuclease VII small subunit [Coriobacteriia bacterium]|nr:exodeoxyribonuclease VII small subunit [Coriobacteriia bacterium]